MVESRARRVRFWQHMVSLLLFFFLASFVAIFFDAAIPGNTLIPVYVAFALMLPVLYGIDRRRRALRRFGILACLGIGFVLSLWMDQQERDAHWRLALPTQTQPWHHVSDGERDWYVLQRQARWWAVADRDPQLGCALQPFEQAGQLHFRARCGNYEYTAEGQPVPPARLALRVVPLQAQGRWLLRQ